MSTTTPPCDAPEARRVSRGALSEAEQLTGAPVTVVKAQSLPTFPTIRVARGSHPAYVIEQRPDCAWAGLQLQIDAWAALLGVADWCEWQPAERAAAEAAGR